LLLAGPLLLAGALLSALLGGALLTGLLTGPLLRGSFSSFLRLLCGHEHASCEPGFGAEVPREPKVCCKTYIATYCDLSTKKVQRNRGQGGIPATKTLQKLRAR